MECIEDITQWQSLRSTLAVHKAIGFVPTMGCLHAGHAALVQRALQENDLTVVSIFVNPMQFNDPCDFKCYPKTLKQDLALLAELGVDYVLLPSVEQLYPSDDFMSISCQDPLMGILEGKYRPGHFQGVLTVVMKLFQLVQPTRAYFGEKDYQQCLLIKKLVRHFFLPIEMIICPTVREASGLPMSSRNQRLNAEQRKLAEAVVKIFHQTTPENLEMTKEKLTRLGVEVEYLEVYEEQIFTAVTIGDVRLIDHFHL